MKKKVLIITSRSEKTVAWRERERYVKEFCAAVEEQLENVSVSYTTYRDLEYTVRDGKTAIYDTLNKLDLRDVHLVQFKNWQYETGEAPVVAEYLKAHGVLYFNSEAAVPIAPGKLAQMFLLGARGVPVPDTFYSSKELMIARFQADKLPEGFAYPLIMKANDGSRGDDNHLVREAKEAIDILTASDPEKVYVLQNFIPNDGDYRLLYIGLDEQPLVFHRMAAGESHLNNTSKGGAGKFLDISQLPKEYLKYARQAAELLGREIGGVDILVDKVTGKAYVLEVNGTPALATGYGVDIKSSRFAQFLQRALETQEDE